MNKPYIKRVFPGGNTPQGFYSFYDFILSKEEGEKLIILKGGPGVGKSSFIKKLGQKFLDLGYDLEYHHCSSDPKSMDGLVIPALKIGIIDGTAPHMIDPIYPGAIDEILYLGDFWDEKGLKENKKDIIRIKKQTSGFFQTAYRYLKAAGIIYENWALTGLPLISWGEYHLKTDSLVKEIFKDIPISLTPGKRRHLFGSAITPEGLTDFLPSILEQSTIIYRIIDQPTISAQSLMNTIAKEAMIHGFSIESYHSPIVVDKIEDLLIPDLGIALTVSNPYHKADITPTYTIDLTTCINAEELPYIQAELEEDQKLFEELLNKSIHCLKKAKASHHELERCYIPYMNFSLVDELIEKTFQRLVETIKVRDR
ncbi:MAG: ATPase [Epulopiscium sp.]|nr:ATPase [Candidatus Epulonipiscium sp.]